jgi:hypothetical protein
MLFNLDIFIECGPRKLYRKTAKTPKDPAVLNSATEWQLYCEMARRPLLWITGRATAACENLLSTNSDFGEKDRLPPRLLENQDRFRCSIPKRVGNFGSDRKMWWILGIFFDKLNELWEIRAV